jgi:cobyrinic acid a,c-diamide synthase
MRRGFLVAAPHSGSGKTVITLGILRAFANAGEYVVPFKAGPDFIDPAFHTAAAKADCFNLDPWGMRPRLISSLADGGGLTVIEGMMGLFDGAADGSGSCADLAALLDLPIVLVIDCARQSQSVAALVRGFRDHRPDIRIAALILNRVSTERHERLLRQALEKLGIPVAGVIPALDLLKLPERHLGLVQAGEHEALEAFISTAATLVKYRIDLDLLSNIGAKPLPGTEGCSKLPPLGQTIAVARDEAFAFAYPHILSGWREQGVELSFFSPLKNEVPEPEAEAIYLPGGYPELHAGRLASATSFRAGMIGARDRGAVVYGECGGFMVLGESLTDAGGIAHPMLGLLPVETSFATRTRHLGYRKLKGRPGTLYSGQYRAHEFHYSTLVRQGEGMALFDAEDATGAALGAHGLQIGRVAGSYMHLIDLDGDA